MKDTWFDNERCPIILRYSSVSTQGDYRPPELAGAHACSRRQTVYLARNWTVVTLDLLIASRGEVSFPTNCVIITFDGGYRDNIETALPILTRYGLSATFFVTSDPVLGRGGYWPEWLHRAVSAAPEEALRQVVAEFLRMPDQVFSRGRIFALLARQVHLSWQGTNDNLLADAKRILRMSSALCAPSEFMMNLKDLHELRRAGMSIGSYTATYRNLAQLDRLEALIELVGSKVELEMALDQPIEHLAYPEDYALTHSDASTMALAKLSRYRSASSTYARASMQGSLYDLPRQPISEADGLQGFIQRFQDCLRKGPEAIRAQWTEE